tara:strand:+ start:3897 stop:4691 length:795 start_codon:yes stop_codon:yes gene_type:complete
MDEHGPSVVLSATEKNVCTITINRPERRNALNDAVVAGLVAAFESAGADNECRAIVLTGSGDRAFCAGGDLKAGADGGPFIGDMSQPEHRIIQLFRLMDNCTKPIIARINGHAMGGGTGLVCACDIAVMADTARIGTPEVKIGLFPMTIIPHMMRVIPRRRLLEMFITGEPWSAAQALEYDIVNYVVESGALDAKVAELTDLIVARSPTAVRLGKYSCHAMQDMTIEQQFRFAETMLPRMAMTHDAKEGFSAFVEKRDPQWTGK